MKSSNPLVRLLAVIFQSRNGAHRLSLVPPGAAQQRYKAVAIGLIALLAGLALTAGGMQWQRAHLDGLANSQFRQEADRIEREVLRRLTLPQYGLNGLRGTYAANNAVQRAGFRAYVDSRHLAEEFPGIRGMGFVERVQRDGLAGFITKVRADDAPDFAVTTSGMLADLFVVKFIEPMAQNASAWGLDIGQEPVRREGAERAMNTGQPALTSKITLVQDHSLTPGFLLFVPVYRNGTEPATPAQRQAALIGLAVAPIVASELFQGLTGAGEADTSFSIYQGTDTTDTTDTTNAQLVYRDSGLSAAVGTTPVPLYKSVRHVTVAGSDLSLQVHSTLAFERKQDHSTLTVAGMLATYASLAVAFAAWLLAAGQARAQQLAQSMTADLDRMARVAQYTNNAVSVSDAQLRITWVNAGFTRLTGYAAEEAIGQTPEELLSSGKSDQRVLQTLATSIAAGTACRVELLDRAKDGREYWVDVEVQPIHDADNALVGFMEIGTDITERKQAQATVAQTSERFALAAQSAGIGVWEWDVAQQVLTWDAQMYRLYQRTEQTSVTTLNLLMGSLHADDQERLKNNVQETIRHNKNFESDYRITWPNGEIRYLRASARAVRDGAGRAVRLIGVSFDITELKRTQEALIESEAFLDRASRIAGVGGWRMNLKDDSVHWSAEIRRIHEVAHDFVPTLERVMHFYAPEAQPILQAAVQHGLATGQGWDLELPLVTATGRAIWVRAVGEVEFEDGVPVMLVGAFQDITERRRRDEVLHLLESSIDRINDVVLITKAQPLQEPGPQVVYVNRAFETVTGYTRADALGRTPRMLQGPDTNPAARARIAQALALGEAITEELLNYKKDGTVYWLEIVLSPIHSAAGELTHYVAVERDITERRKQDQALLKSNQLMADVLQNLPCGLSVFDGNLVLVAQNPQLRSLLGLPDGLFSGAETTFEEIIRYNAQAGEYGPGDVEATVSAIVERAGHPVAHIFERQRPNGVSLEIRGVPLPGGGFITTYVDISESKKAQQLLTLALAAAQQANVSKSQFLANMSHEIRTPMNAILGLLQLLQKTELDVRQHDYAAKTEGAARSLLGLLNDILDFSKVEAGKMVLDPRPFHVERLLRDLSVIFSANVGQKDLEVLFDVDPALPLELVGDDMRLQQILINLGGNAIKFTAQGAVVLRLRQLGRTNTSVTVEFAVQDSGIGIAPDNQALIFSGFTQAEASTTRRFGGTGLGLAISSRLVRLMGGELALQSALGSGSTFSFAACFALAALDGVAPAPLQAMESKSESLRTLVVDDHPLARALTVRLAQSLGWQADTAASGAEALTQVREAISRGQPYQAIFMDWQMPGMDGWTTTQRIREIVTEPTVIMMVTAYGQEMLAQRSVQEQSLLNGFLVKPVTASLLREALQDAQAVIALAASGLPPKIPQVLLVTPKRLQGLHILVVEDNPVNQIVAEGLLRAEGARVTLAEDGQQGVAAVAAAQRPFDVVMMDLQMPVMDGYTATRVLRAEMGRAQLPIIAMTANAMASDRAECLEAGMNDHIGKPFDLDHLVAVILQHTGRAPAAGGTPATSNQNAVVPTPAATHFVLGDLNLDAAALRLGGDTTMLASIARIFADDLPQVTERLQAQWRQGQWQDAKRTLHTLKGAALTVGARHLGQVAARLEAQCKGDLAAAEWAALVTQLQGAVDATVQSLALALQRYASTALQAQSASVSLSDELRSTLREDLRALTRLLQASDGQALQAYAKLQDRYGTALGARLAPLDRAINDLEFQTASQCSDALLAGVLAEAGV